jgi:hypothetical protein
MHIKGYPTHLENIELKGISDESRGVQKNRITEKTKKTDGKLTEKTEPR